MRCKDNIAFNKINAVRILACLILSETISPNVLPFDPFEAQLFFKIHVKRSKHEPLRDTVRLHTTKIK